MKKNDRRKNNKGPKSKEWGTNFLLKGSHKKHHGKRTTT